MGISGLTKYVSERSCLYMKSFELHDCYLLVDGNNICALLYVNGTTGDSIFGGNYDEYYKIVKQFFLNFKKCNITPIVLFDGGHETKKIKTVLTRAKAKMDCLKALARKYSSTKFFPPFMRDVFIDVMEELEIVFIQCDLEADSEIATVARALNCPVLSYDSDFYIYDVLYIPFNAISIEPVTVKLPDKKLRHFIQCSIFDTKTFLSEFDGLGKSLLPILTTVLGNDYTDSSVFDSFFKNIFQRNPMKMNRQTIIHSFLSWLKHKNFDSAVKGILHHLKIDEAKKVMNAINFNLYNYNSGLVSPSVFSEIKKLVDEKKSTISLQQKKSDYNMPLPIQMLFKKGQINPFVTDLINLRSYFTSVIVEDFSQNSCHLLCLNIIKAIFAILRKYTEKNLCVFKMYRRVKSKYLPLEVNISSFDLQFNEDIYNEPSHVRFELFYNILNFNSEDVEKVSAFNSTWSLFVIAFIFWAKSLKAICTCQAHAMLLMAVANQVVQKKVGHYETCSSLKKQHKSLLEKYKNIKVVKDNNKNDFEKMLISVTKLECLMAQKALIPLRHTSSAAKNSEFFLSTIYLFNCFQSCLLHICQLNALLNLPLPHLKVHEFYSGTLLYNLYINIKKDVKCENYGMKILTNAPNVQKIYVYLYENLITNRFKGPHGSCKVVKKKKKIKKKKHHSDGSCTDGTEEDEEFIDLENPFYLLDGME